MKNKTLIILTSVALMSCAISKNKNRYKLSNEEINEYHHSNDTIYHKGIVLGYISSFEFEYNPNNKEGLVVEISITQLNRKDDMAGDKILKYVHTKQPNAKIEINFDKENENQ